MSLKNILVITAMLMVASLYAAWSPEAQAHGDNDVFTSVDGNTVLDLEIEYYTSATDKLTGMDSSHSPASVMLASKEVNPVPPAQSRTALYPLFPNPFNPYANISYELAESAKVRIEIFNLRGQLVRSFNEGLKPNGVHRITWDGKDKDGSDRPSGMFLVKMSAGKQNYYQKVIMMK